MRRCPEEQFLATVVAFETVLAGPDLGRGNPNAKKIAIWMSWFGGNSLDGRFEIYQRAKRIDDKRSFMVHGFDVYSREQTPLERYDDDSDIRFMTELLRKLMIFVTDWTFGQFEQEVTNMKDFQKAWRKEFVRRQLA